ncbi:MULTISPECIES: RNA polymerase sigma factor [unclassified Ensifer]|uniref:RNA polymerase sigma factor n=1 Tax=unclassified Ensifer TaxID=2633371 RepID=UPI000812EB5E|nr:MULTISPECIES: RNA polymerase sigma factor [unclassified Ensifer]OCP05739.1 RNA polymerase subunit sigma [Ensifer sp. LC11]OCP06484.1 RNA polymerase subunit sigma [Ensifer sp. LC13]OCP06790.1 RNA polymerase subunit sigma [Ensifer sp. LC14]OCP31277.1 RNA polymerase subunit sigma [Ensifer sp. LC499]
MKDVLLQTARAALRPDHLSEQELLRRARSDDPEAFRTIMRRYNQRLFRIARAVVRNDSIAEDVVQEAYLRAFEHLETFRGDASLATWLHRVVLNEALGRLRKSSTRREVPLATEQASADIVPFPNAASAEDPERALAQRQILRLVEEATDALPEPFRLVFTARVIEAMSVEETAALLGIKPETVRTRLHRARQLLRQQIDRKVGPVLLNAFPFAGRRCERLTEAVMNRLGFQN